MSGMMQPHYRQALFVAVVYAIFGGLWIAFSDRLAATTADDVATLTALQTWKGWFYVAVTAVLVFILVARALGRQAALMDRMRQASTVFENTRDGIVVTDLDARIVAVNPAFTAMTGYSEEEVVGENPRLLQSGRHGRDFYQAMWAAITETGYWQGEVWNRRKDGLIYPERKTINAVRDETGWPTRYVAVSTDITHAKDSEERIEHLAHYDPLTDLPNRLLAQSRLQHAIDHARRHGHRVGVLSLDIDRFKNVNDSLGHAAGDELLVGIAAALRGGLREDDTLARIGGDEFLVMFEYLERPEEAAVAAQALIDRIGQPFLLADAQDIYVGASIGISIFPDDADTVTDLLQHADTAMTQAKNAGRNTYRFYTAALTVAASERLEVETHMRQALERDEFVLHYQPLVAGRDGERVIGVEVLLRWQPSGGEMILPDRFIPIAEETGLIVPIGEWVLRTACAQARAWDGAGLPPLTIAVNISGRQLQRSDVVRTVRLALEESGLAGERLELELTESMLMGRGRGGMETLQELKALGVRLAIDDFGTGYSSLAYLSRMPIDKLKIDKSFVRDLAVSEDDREIAATIIAMARNLKLDVLAEGVESAGQAGILADMGCDCFQGYYFARPQPAPEIEAFLRRPARSALRGSG